MKQKINFNNSSVWIGAQREFLGKKDAIARGEKVIFEQGKRRGFWSRFVDSAVLGLSGYAFDF